MSTRKRNLIILTALLGICVLWLGREITLRMWAYLDKLDQEIKACNLQLAYAQMEIKNNSDYDRKWERIRNFQDESIAVRQTQFLSYLNSLETELNFDFDDLSPPSQGQPLEQNQQFQVLSYTLTFSAELKDLVEFLDLLDRSEKLLCVDRLEITKPSYTLYRGWITSPGDLSVKITISIPTAAPEAEPEKEPFL